MLRTRVRESGKRARRNNRDAQEETIYKSQTKGNKETSLICRKGYTGNSRKRGIRETRKKMIRVNKRLPP